MMNTQFTTEEYADIHFVYRFFDGNAWAMVKSIGVGFPTVTSHAERDSAAVRPEIIHHKFKRACYTKTCS
jgi:hypothetical protein